MKSMKFLENGRNHDIISKRFPLRSSLTGFNTDFPMKTEISSEEDRAGKD